MNKEQIAKLYADAQHDLLAGCKAKNMDLQDIIALCQAAERTTSPDRKSCCAHDSDCAVHNAPALPVGPCDCSLANAEPQAQAEPVAFDADDLPRYDVQDGRMAREMDGRFVKLSDVRAAMKGKP